jgi:t-SNARE complex subunit (syntaxin)
MVASYLANRQRRIALYNIIFARIVVIVFGCVSF